MEQNKHQISVEQGIAIPTIHPSMDKIRQIVRYIGIAAAAVALTAGIMKKSRLESSISYYDATGDGIQDIILFDAKNKEQFAFIGRGNGTFEKARLILQDGIPFYETENGYYTTKGDFLPFRRCRETYFEYSHLPEFF